MKASTLSQRPMDVFRTFFLRFVVTIIALGAITISGISNADAITRVGPIDPVHGFPMWYEDQNGLRLDYCDDPACFFLVPDPALPPSFPANWPDEAFYWVADASMSVSGGIRAILVQAREAAFAQGPVIDGDQVTFSRIRLFIDGAPVMVGNTYTVTHPYGTVTFVSQPGDAGPGAKGPGLSHTADVGLGAPGDFNGAMLELNPFLIPASMNLNALINNPGTLLDPGVGGGVAVPAQGSPTGNNFFRIEGPNIGDVYTGHECADPALGGETDPITGAQLTNDCVETDLFTFAGRVSLKNGVAIDKATYDNAGPLNSHVNIAAHSVEGQNITASVDGGADVPLAEGPGGNYFARLAEGVDFSLLPGATQPGTVTVTNQSDNPVSTKTANLVDEIAVTKAEYSYATGSLEINILAGDLNAPLTVDPLQSGFTVNFLPPGSPLAFVSEAVIAPGVLQVIYQHPDLLNQVPPLYVEVTSANGGFYGGEVSVVTQPAPSDTTAPVITLNGINPVNLIVGGLYTDLGATALDDINGIVSVNTIANTVDTATPGNYVVMYTASDLAGNVATAARNVNVAPPVDNTAPVITINGLNPESLIAGGVYTDAGATAVDNLDPAVNVTATSTVNTSVPGNYIMFYSAIDAAGNFASAVRNVTVLPSGDITPPTITAPADVTVGSMGPFPIAVTLGSPTVSDNVSAVANITVINNAPASFGVGNTIVTWTATDEAGNSAIATQLVTVTDTTPAPDTTAPVITMLGNTVVNMTVGGTYTDAGATASDNVDGDITANIATVNSVNPALVGSYTVTYNVSDAAGNAAAQVTRTVNVNPVPDTTAPVITMLGNAVVNMTVGGTYTDAGATAADNVDGDITANIATVNSVNPALVGSYTVTYNVSDAAGNPAAPVSRTVNVNAVPDTTAPVITLLGNAVVNMTVGGTYTDAGATAADNVDGDITANIVAGGLVDVNTVGSYTLTYNVSDAAGNAAAQVTRTVNVNAVTGEVCSLSRALYIGGAFRDFWSISGTSDTLQGQSVTVYLGPVGDTTRVIGATTVSSTGRISLTTARGSATGNGTVPQLGDTEAWIQTSLGCTASANIRQIGN